MNYSALPDIFIAFGFLVIAVGLVVQMALDEIFARRAGRMYRGEGQ
ncbi:MAG: hypothetical protein JST28_09280 [Acidobacteria bacterium]|nr:hypothetical protein [Acidobacteriota bacterium]